MSKKKVSGNTMTLKDFHGGSIPSDLPLPSAPGVIVRVSDRPAWGNHQIIGQRAASSSSRPHISPATRHFDDKTPFLTTHSLHGIGRNFDEDERTPLDGVPQPRRTIVHDSSVRVAAAPPPRTDTKPVIYANNARVWAAAAPRSPGAGGVGAEVEPRGQPNAWGMRKETVSEPVQAVWSGQSAVVKMAHASALDKVSSGRWQSKPSIQYQTSSVEVTSSADVGGYGSETYNRMDVMSERQSYDASLARQVERGIQINDVRKEFRDYELAKGSAISTEVKDRNPIVRKELPDYERGRVVPIVAEVRDMKPTMYSNRVQAVPSELVDHPKLKLLPRTRPADHFEAPVIDQTQEYQHPVHVKTVNEVYGNTISAKPGSAGSEAAKLAVERPKLNLKPRSQPLEHLDVTAERERNALFGGARPRELVLKERKVDDVVINNSGMVQHSDKVEHRVPRVEDRVPRAEHHSPKADRVPRHANPTRHHEKAENHPFDQRTGKKLERDNQVERADMQNRNWRNDGRKNNRETDRQPQQSERPPSPETWRKPEQPKPSSPDGVRLHHGKAASALELAQTFSRSISDPKLHDQLSGQRGIPTRGGQIPFSRLMGPTPRPQINGY